MNINPTHIDQGELAFIEKAIKRMLLETWTCIPAVVVNVGNGTVDVVPVTRGARITADGYALQEYPVMVGVPVAFPGNSGMVLTFPITAGDECLLLFTSRDFDGWYGSGEISDPQSLRIHDMSDAVAYFGIRNQTNLIPSISATAAQFRTNDGLAKVSLGADHSITIVAPGGLSIVADITHTGNQTSSGTITGQTDVKAGSKPLLHHVHTDPQGGNTGEIV